MKILESDLLWHAGRFGSGRTTSTLSLWERVPELCEGG